MLFDGRTYLLLYVLSMYAIHLQAQVEDVFLEEQIIEQLVEDMEFEFDVGEITERLRYYQRNPLDLNTVTEEQLVALVFLTPMQIANLLYHRDVSGAFISVLELQAIPGFDVQTVALLRNFVRVGDRRVWDGFRWQNLVKQSDYELMVRYGRIVQRQRGYQIEDEDRSRYLGSPDRVAVRFRSDYEQQVRVAVNMDKDAGESFFRDAQAKGFDFYSGSILVRDLGNVKNLVVGDYALQFGQGLVAWNGLNFGKGAWIGSVARQGSGLRQYKSLNESNFMRGAAAHLQYGKWHITPFASWNKLTGNVTEDDGQRTIHSINHSGYHRTPTEQRNRRAINQYAYGTNVTYQYKRLKLGVTGMVTQFDGVVQPANLLRNRFDFVGDRLANVGIHYQYTVRNLFFYGEAAHSVGSGIATTNGVFASLSPKLTAIANYRHYQADYHHFFAQSIGEQSTVGNEKGMYGGLVYHPSRRIEWLTYLDVFAFPWLRFRADAPTHGLDFLSQFSYIWYKRGRLTFRYRHRLREENLSLAERNENLLANLIRRQARIDFLYQIDDRWSIRSRAELAHYDKEHDGEELGVLVFQDLLWTARAGRWSANARIAYFQTDSYNSRIYAYEQDVLYGAGFPVYYGMGYRMYANGRIRLGRRVDLWMRYAMTYYPSAESIGSQLDLIEGNKRSDFRVQVRYRW